MRETFEPISLGAAQRQLLKLADELRQGGVTMRVAWMRIEDIAEGLKALELSKEEL